MKTKFSGWLVGFIALTLGMVSGRSQGFTAAPNNYAALTNAAVYQVAPTQTTNCTAAQKKAIALGNWGFAFTYNVGATQSTASTNGTIRFEFSVDGTNYDTKFRTPISMPTPGSGGCVSVTNIDTALVRNFKYVRLYSIQNTNNNTGDDLFFTNLVFSVRP